MLFGYKVAGCQQHYLRGIARADMNKRNQRMCCKYVNMEEWVLRSFHEVKLVQHILNSVP